MLDEQTKQEILKSISLRGGIDKPQINPIVKQIDISAGELDTILDRSAGLPRIKSYKAKLFNLVLLQPPELSELNPFEIRCCLCHSVVSYPAWHYNVRYAINSLHYFICFSTSSSQSPTTNCIRR